MVCYFNIDKNNNVIKLKLKKFTFTSAVLKSEFPFKFYLNIAILRNYRVYHGFGQAKFACGGSILGSSQFTLLPQLPQKMMLGLKVVKINLKISNSIC